MVSSSQANRFWRFSFERETNWNSVMQMQPNFYGLREWKKQKLVLGFLHWISIPIILSFWCLKSSSTKSSDIGIDGKKFFDNTNQKFIRSKSDRLQSSENPNQDVIVVSLIFRCCVSPPTFNIPYECYFFVFLTIYFSYFKFITFGPIISKFSTKRVR